MRRRDFLATLPAVAAAPAIIRSSRASAQDAITLRVATLAPNGSAWMRVLNAWNNSLKQRTNNRLQFRFYAGGAAGDERDAVRKMRVGQMDGAVITTVGLAQIVRPVLVLQAPGVCTSYAKIDAVRAQLASEFEREFDTAGYKLMGWGDAGTGRIFANRAVVSPSDMRQTRMWSWRDDPLWQSVLTAANVNGVELGLPEVYPALQTNRIDAFPGTAIAAVAFQWHTKATHVTGGSHDIVIGATVLKKDKFDPLPADLKTALLETSAQAHQSLARTIRRDDDRALQTILDRGVTQVNTAPQQAAWDQVFRTARNSLAGRLYSADLLARVEQIARGAR